MHRTLIFAAAVLASGVSAGEPSALERVIIQDAKAVLGRQVEGGLHCPARLPGSFDELAEAPMRRLRELRESVLKDLPYEETRSFQDAAAGRGTFVPSAAYAEWIQQAAGPARQIRAALCAKAGRVAPGLILFGGWGEKAPYDWLDLGRALQLAHWEARKAPEAGPLMPVCLDSLAAAQLSAPHSLIGRMLAAQFVRDGFDSCREAINVTPAGELSGLGTVLRGLASRPSFSQVMRDERVFAQLAFFGASYSTEAREQLPREAEALILWGQNQPPELNGFDAPPFAAGARRFLFGGWARRRHFEQMQQAIEAVGLPLESAVARLAELNHDVPMAVTLVGHDAAVSENFGQMLRRDAEHRAMVQMLIMAVEVRRFRMERGAWPTSLAQVEGGAEASEWMMFRMTESGPLLKLLASAFPDEAAKQFLLEEIH